MLIEDAIHVKFKDPQQRMMVNLRYTSNFMSQIQSVYMLKFDLSMAQFNVLRILRGANTPLSVNTVKDRMIEKSPNTSRLLDKLFDKKLLDRERCSDDKRIYFVKITQLGLKVLSEIDEHLTCNPLINSNLTDDEADQLSNLLDKIRIPYEQ